MKILSVLFATVLATTMTFAQGEVKMTPKEAKKECKAEGKRGKELKKCVKEKLHK